MRSVTSRRVFLGLSLIGVVLLYASSFTSLVASGYSRDLRFETVPENSVPERVIGLEMAVPATWAMLKERKAESGRELITINNFSGNYLHGGLLPRGGVEISIVARLFKTRLDLDGLIAEYLEGDTDRVVKMTMVAGCRATRVESQASFAPEIVYRRDTVFLLTDELGGTVLYKFVQLQNATGPQAAPWAFHGLLESAKFDAVPPPCHQKA